MKFYPPQMVEGMEVPHCTLRAYLEQNMPGRAVPAVHYYGNDISWDELLKKADQVAKALHALGIGEGTGFRCSCSRCRSFCICCWPRNR